MLCHVPWQQLVDTIGRVIGNPFKHIGEIRFGSKAVQACRAVPIRLYMAAARSPPESAPANR